MLHLPTSMKTLLLRAGERRLVAARSGSRWVAVRGDLRLSEPPRWLGERVVALELTLREGTEHVLENGGWITLSTATDSVLRAEAPRSIASIVAVAWRIIRSARAPRVAA
jgi:hypothetical protein